ncbi:protein EOLA1-like [Amphiura filiformis]|uniref:protein EOLA1-like n=1 Tax=Amphiura filiformis TaxID=82378 RepID=UPI003B226FC6
MAVRLTKNNLCKSRNKPYEVRGHNDARNKETSNKLTKDEEECVKQDTGSDDRVSYPCISARQPYAGLMLNGFKTIETRWTPMLKELSNQTVAIHIAQRTWEGDEWRDGLCQRGLSHMQIDCIVTEAENCARGSIAGLIDVGETWQCSADDSSDDGNKATEWEKDALLKPLEEKYLTRLTNPRWLKKPIKSRGQKGVWTVTIPAKNI